MTPTMWAGSDPVDGPARPSVPRVSARRRPMPAAFDEVPATWMDLDAAVGSIGEHALKVNLARARDLQEAVVLAGEGQLEDTRRAAAVETAHKLVGSAGTFGFPGASDLAAELEKFFARTVFDEQQLLSASDQVTALLAELATEPDF